MIQQQIHERKMTNYFPWLCVLRFVLVTQTENQTVIFII